MKITYFQDGDGYLAVTDKSPKDFKGVLFIGKSGVDLEVKEVVFTPEQLRGLPQIDKSDMPAAWILAFGYEQPDPVELEPVFDEDGENLLDLAPVRRPRRQPEPKAPAAPRGPDWPFRIFMLIGGIILAVCYVTGIFWNRFEFSVVLRSEERRGG